MLFLSLDYIKQHSRLDMDCEDGLIESYGDSAEETLAQYLGRGKTVEEMIDSLKAEYGKIPSPIYYAGVLLVDASYQYRTPISTGNVSLVPYTFDMIIKPYMKL